MQKPNNMDIYLDAIIDERLFFSKGRLKFYLNTIFKNINFEDKIVLDIGGGSGLFSFFAAYQGANESICLEPEVAGSTSGITDKFDKLKNLLNLNNVILEPLSFLDFKPEGKKFDVILLHNSINHLDETACINLLKNEKSQDIYKELFSKLSSMANPGAKLIICDCSRYNIFHLLKIRNPFFPTIEWHKHQSPKVWANLLSGVGFVNPKIKWSSFSALGNIGRFFLGNKVMAYFLRSHFCLTLKKT